MATARHHLSLPEHPTVDATRSDATAMESKSNTKLIPSKEFIDCYETVFQHMTKVARYQYFGIYKSYIILYNTVLD